MTAFLDRKFVGIKDPFLVVCEGYNDARFVLELLEHNKIAGCSVGCPSIEGGHGSGSGAIKSYLKAVQAATQLGRASLRGVLVLADADESAEKCFSRMSDALRSASFPAPSTPFEIEGDSFRTGIFIVPGPGKTGTLEHFLWEAAVDQTPNLESCTDAFFECVRAPLASATENQKAKMKLSATLGALCKDNPWTSLALAWRDSNNPIPIQSERFQDLINFLTMFTA